MARRKKVDDELRAEIVKKQGYVIRLSKEDMKEIRDALDTLKSASASRPSKTGEREAALASPTVAKFIDDVHQCLCMSRGAEKAKVVVIDVE